MKIRQSLVKYILFGLTLCLSFAVHADMLISPTRVLMDHENKSTTMVLRNNSNGSRTYRLSWEDKRATEDGGYNMVSESEEWPSAKDMIRVSPRQITVGPNENQTVRFNWRPPADLPSGEYRSHLLLQVIPDISEPTSTLGAETSQEGVGIQVFMQMSFSIPVVVRHDTEAPQITMESIKAVPTKNSQRMGLEMVFNRTGNASSFGKISVEMQRDANSPVEVISQSKELSIYPEIDKRTFTIPLSEASIPEGAFVRVAYEGAKEYEGILWAEQVFQAE
ncbi:molecular chaperone [Granulosicoccus antarcticus]|uniref:Pili assembly chaperone N-terminal domain-containing protein n=1 Tax=Granulosicoccus antarcticus IMCC3135 TaxID=1192854 RepID=A0A2Z2P5G5_9GAMM|nr:molecular chaperone [Granulosicoccus antarcticus]ASJ75937.1 hypothetical protein IMCC3135_29435 [Granulosicoccus antarcticus IMCC3135]